MSTFVSTNGQTSAYLAPPFLQDGDIFKEIDTDGWEAAGFALDLRELTGEPASQISGQTITFTLNTLGYAFSDITAEWFIESRADYEDLTGKASLTDPYYLAGNYFGGIFDFGNQSYGQAPPGTGPLSDESTTLAVPQLLGDSSLADDPILVIDIRSAGLFTNNFSTPNPLEFTISINLGSSGTPSDDPAYEAAKAELTDIFRNITGHEPTELRDQLRIAIHASEISSGEETIDQWKHSFIDVYKDSAGAALEISQIMTGKIPSDASALYSAEATLQSILDLAGPSGGPANAWTAYGASYADSKYSSAFHSEYDGLSNSAFITKAISEIFNTDTSADQLANLESVLTIYKNYYAQYADNSDPSGAVRAKGAFLGDMLLEASDGGWGTYPNQSFTFLQKLTVATASFGTTLASAAGPVSGAPTTTGYNLKVTFVSEESGWSNQLNLLDRGQPTGKAILEYGAPLSASFSLGASHYLYLALAQPPANAAQSVQWFADSNQNGQIDTSDNMLFQGDPRTLTLDMLSLGKLYFVKFIDGGVIGAGVTYDDFVASVVISLSGNSGLSADLIVSSTQSDHTVGQPISDSNVAIENDPNIVSASGAVGVVGTSGLAAAAQLEPFAV